MYGNDLEFKDFNEQVGKTKHLALSDMAYLMPRKQRCIARFMNMYPTVDWTFKIPEKFQNLTPKEKHHFSFVPRNASLVEELKEVISVFEQVMSLCKNKGFSKDIADTCKTIIRRGLSAGNQRQKELGDMMLGYIEEESRLLTEEHPTHNISTDIIESKFGILKSAMPTCRTAGFTESVLHLPLSVKFATLEKIRETDIVSIMERMTMENVKNWKNPVSKKIQ